MDKVAIQIRSILSGVTNLIRSEFRLQPLNSLGYLTSGGGRVNGEKKCQGVTKVAARISQLSPGLFSPTLLLFIEYQVLNCSGHRVSLGVIGVQSGWHRCEGCWVFRTWGASGELSAVLKKQAPQRRWLSRALRGAEGNIQLQEIWREIVSWFLKKRKKKYYFAPWVSRDEIRAAECSEL